VSGVLPVISPSTRDKTDAEERAAMAIATKAEMENFMTGNKWERKKSSVGYYLI
jgi:hypothetical protein